MSNRRPWITGLALPAVAAAMAVTALAAIPASTGKGWPVRQDGEFTAVETPHYRVRTDMGTDIAELIAVHQEALFAALFQRMNSFKPAVGTSIPRLDVVAVKTKEKYEEIVGKDAKGTQGIYSPSTSKIGVMGSPDSLDSLLATLRHEGTHQFTGLYLGPKCPIWLNEGLSEFFMHGQYRDGQFVTGQVPAAPLAGLKQALADNKFIPVADLVNLSADEWSAAVKARGAGATLQYNESWAIVHCLEAADNAKYRGPFIQYMGMVAHGIAPAQAWTNAFGSPPAALDKRLRDYVAALKPTEGIGCRGNLMLLGALVLKSRGVAADIKTLRDFGQSGGLADSIYSGADGVKLEFKDADLAKLVFRCPEDTSKGDAPSYELAPGKEGEAMIVRCRHHPGFVLETTYTVDSKAGVSIGVVSKPASAVPPAAPAKTGTAPSKKPAPTPTGATKP